MFPKMSNWLEKEMCGICMARQVLVCSLLMNCVALLWINGSKPAADQNIICHQQAWKNPRQHPTQFHCHLEG